MRVFAAYKITQHGEPVYPEFIFKTKHRLERYIDENGYEWEKFTIKELNLDIPKFGISQREMVKEEVLSKQNIKEVNITFKGNDKQLHKFTGSEAINMIKSLKNNHE